MKAQQFSHFIQRAKERYDLDLTLDDLQTIAETIKSGKAKLTQLDSHSVRYKVRFNSKLLVVILDREHTHFITTLPLNKYTQSSSFNKQSFTYIDALYMNWQFSQLFDTSRLRCPICGCKDILSDLGYNRFKCPKCFHLTKFKEPCKKDIRTSVYDDGVISSALDLSMSFWWYLYRTHKYEAYDNIKITPVLLNDDNFGYSILCRKQEKIVPVGIHLIKDLRRKEHDIRQKVLSGLE